MGISLQCYFENFNSDNNNNSNQIDTSDQKLIKNAKK